MRTFAASTYLAVEGDLPDMRLFRYGVPTQDVGIAPRHGAATVRVQSSEDLPLHRCTDAIRVYNYAICAAHDLLSFHRHIPLRGTAALELGGLAGNQPYVKTNRAYDWWSALRGTRVSRTVALVSAMADLALLSKRLLPLHCSVVAHNGRAVVLMAPPDTGKTRTALTLARLGCPILAEDIAIAGPNGMVAGCPQTRTVERSPGSKAAGPRGKTSILDLDDKTIAVETEAVRAGTTVFLGAGEAAIEELDVGEASSLLNALNLLEFDYFRREPVAMYLAWTRQLSDAMQRQWELSKKFMAANKRRFRCVAPDGALFAEAVRTQLA